MTNVAESMHQPQWEALYSDSSSFGNHRLPELLRTLPRSHPALWTGPELLVRGEPADRLIFLCEHEGAVRHLMVILGDSKRQVNHLYSACPIAANAARADVSIIEVEPSASGLEALVTAEWQDHSFTFSDPLYFLAPHLYQIGTIQRVRLSAFCLLFQAQKEDRVTIDDPEVAEKLRNELGIPASQKVEFKMTDFVTRREIDEEPAYYSFASPLKNLSTLSENGLDLNCAVITVVRANDDLDIPMYVAAHIAAGHPDAEIGAMAQGVYWLQGTLAQSHDFLCEPRTGRSAS